MSIRCPWRTGEASHCHAIGDYFRRQADRNLMSAGDRRPPRPLCRLPNDAVHSKLKPVLCDYCLPMDFIVGERVGFYLL
jgi:hypothetical protein